MSTKEDIQKISEQFENDYVSYQLNKINKDIDVLFDLVRKKTSQEEFDYYFKAHTKFMKHYLLSGNSKLMFLIVYFDNLQGE